MSYCVRVPSLQKDVIAVDFPLLKVEDWGKRNRKLLPTFHGSQAEDDGSGEGADEATTMSGLYNTTKIKGAKTDGKCSVLYLFLFFR